MTQKSGRATSSRRTNYARGSERERKIRKDLYLEHGALLVVKGGGSKSPIPKALVADVWRGFPPKVDLVAIFRDRVCVFQAKPAGGKLTSDERTGLMWLTDRADVCSYECWWEKGHARFRTIRCGCEYEGEVALFCKGQGAD
jgi:hypothetical protein